MSVISQTYERISRYLKGILSDRERHALEKEMMEDAFDEDAFEGLSGLNAGELSSDMDKLFNRLDRRVDSEKKMRFTSFYRLAAGILLIAGLGTVMYLMFLHKPETRELSQEVRKEAPAETRQPEIVFPEEENQVRENVMADIKSETSTENIARKPEPARENEAVASKKETSGAENAAQPAESKATSGDMMAVISDSAPNGYITGRILGVDRQALAGASITEKGSMQRTVTDINGNFKLKVTDAGSKISITSVGYKAVEVPTREMGGKEITMYEDLTALNDITVVGYGQGKKARSAKQASAYSDSIHAGFEMPFKYTKPVPPQGTLQAFEKWVEDQLNLEKLMELEPGNYKILTNLIVSANGAVSNVTITNNVPGVVEEEYKRAVESSPLWQPAMSDNNPVQSEIEIIFSLTVEE